MLVIAKGPARTEGPERSSRVEFKNSFSKPTDFQCVGNVGLHTKTGEWKQTCTASEVFTDIEAEKQCCPRRRCHFLIPFTSQCQNSMTSSNSHTFLTLLTILESQVIKGAGPMKLKLSPTSDCACEQYYMYVNRRKCDCGCRDRGKVAARGV